MKIGKTAKLQQKTTKSRSCGAVKKWACEAFGRAIGILTPEHSQELAHPTDRLRVDPDATH
jgi:hypothetical protein